jgi:Fasciclin domain
VLIHAGLDLDIGVDYTIFAPTNDAIAALGASALAQLKQDKELLSLVRPPCVLQQTTEQTQN